MIDDEHWEVVSDIMHTCAEGKDSINGQHCWELLKACLPDVAVERACYDLAEPDLQQWQVEVGLVMVLSRYSHVAS